MADGTPPNLKKARVKSGKKTGTKKKRKTGSKLQSSAYRNGNRSLAGNATIDLSSSKRGLSASKYHYYSPGAKSVRGGHFRYRVKGQPQHQKKGWTMGGRANTS